METDHEYLYRAIELAQETRQEGNLPIGAVIRLDNRIVGEGKNSIWTPKFRPNRHAEIEALESVPSKLWTRAEEMTLYTTLEPCVMCQGAILAHHIGRVVFGAKDNRGGASYVFGHLPPAFEARLQVMAWVGPILPEECDELFEQATVLLKEYWERVNCTTS